MKDFEVPALVDDRKVFEAAKQAAERGDIQAQYELSVMYRLGKGVAQDHVQAAYWIQKAITIY